jgi:photosystem II stability/assembly factor-like uncharacterized protein
MRNSLLLASAILSATATVSQGQSWKQIGPSPIDGTGFSTLPNATVSGTITDIAIDPSGSTDSTIYVATASGGIWKTTNGGSSWKAITDSMPVLTMGAVALDPSSPSTVYAGVGGPYCPGAPGSSFTNPGCVGGGGIYRSTDAGDHWEVLDPNQTFVGAAISRIVLPTSGTVLVATNIGLYKSTDGGKHFGNNAPSFDNANPIPISTPQGIVSSGLISDLQLDTATPTTVYVAIDNIGLFKSTDAGTTFPASGKLLSSAGFPPSFTGDVFIKVAQSTQPNNKTIYAFLCVGLKTTAEPCALLKSTDRGALFKRISLGSVISINQQDYDQIVGVDPQDANRVYVGVRQVYYSANGGKTGISISNQIDVNGSHSDDHVIAFSPSSHFTGPPTRIFIGTDGGFASTAAQGSAPGAKWQFLNEGLATALLYDMDIGRGGKANNAYSYGAFQDNGISAATPGAAEHWAYQCCGDGFDVAVDPLNPLHALGINDGGLTATTNPSPNWSGNNSTFPGCNLPNCFVRFDPNGGVAYAVSGAQLFQSTNNGKTFSLMQTFSQNITAINQVKGDKNLIWVGLSNGTIQKTHKALEGSAAPWQPVSVTGKPANQQVTGIAIDPTNTSTVVAIYPGYSDAADPPKHVFLTKDDGVKWTNIGGVPNGGDDNLPDIPLYAVVLVPTTSPHTIVVGSDLGVLQTADLGKTWQVLGTGFPNARVTGLALDYTVKPLLLRASTFGRSAFQLEGSCPLCPPEAQCKEQVSCTGNTTYGYSLSCTGPDVSILYSGNCHDPSGSPSFTGEPILCVAGGNGASKAEASWGDLGGPPYWEGPGSQAHAQVCTSNATGESRCVSVAPKNFPDCTSFNPGPEPPQLCPEGQKWCTKYSPPRCVPGSGCALTPPTAK